MNISATYRTCAAHLSEVERRTDVKMRGFNLVFMCVHIHSSFVHVWTIGPALSLSLSLLLLLLLLLLFLFLLFLFLFLLLLVLVVVCCFVVLLFRCFVVSVVSAVSAVSAAAAAAGGSGGAVSVAVCCCLLLSVALAVAMVVVFLLIHLYPMNLCVIAHVHIVTHCDSQSHSFCLVGTH